MCRNGSLPSRDDLAKPGTLLLYPFRARDPLTGKCYRARYKAERHEIATRYAEWEIIGPPEIRHPIDSAFSPWRS
jgi:hypothetical protein